MKNKVQNGPIARIIRTIGYILVLLSSVFLTVEFIGGFNWQFFKPVVDFVHNELASLEKYHLFGLSIGLLLLVWTQSKSYFLRILTTIVYLFGILGIQTLYPNLNVLPFNLNIEFYQTLLNNTEWIRLIIFVAPLLFVHLVLAYKKPSRISSSTVGSALLLLIFIAVGFIIPIILPDQTWLTTDLARNILYGLAGFSTALMASGSAFGVLGMFRK